jgi:hypothetical protein
MVPEDGQHKPNVGSHCPALGGRDVDPLPESPQHRQWRKARDAASEQIGEFRRETRRMLGEAIHLIDLDSDETSETWFAISDSLQHACWRLGSAIYCLREWAETDDATFDIDQPPLPAERGRRDINRWDRT